MFFTNQQLRLKNMQACRKELHSTILGQIMKVMPPQIQYLYDKRCYDNAQSVMQNIHSTQLEKDFAAKTITEVGQKYSQRF